MVIIYSKQINVFLTGKTLHCNIICTWALSSIDFQRVRY